MATHNRFGPAQRRRELSATLHSAARTVRNWGPMEPRRLQPLDPLLSAPNGRLTLARVTKARAASAHDTTDVQSQDSSAPPALPADELQENAARAHAKAGDADFGRDWRSVVTWKGHYDTRDFRRQSA
jgi:hypothetical protein